MSEKLLLLIDRGLAIVQQMVQVCDLGFERSGPLFVLRRLPFERIQLVLKTLSLGLSGIKFLADVRSLLKESLPACLPALKIGLQLALGALHAAHFGRLLFELVSEISDHAVSLPHLSA